MLVLSVKNPKISLLSNCVRLFPAGSFPSGNRLSVYLTVTVQTAFVPEPSLATHVIAAFPFPFAAIRPDCVTAAAEASLVFHETSLFPAFDGAAAAVSARVLPFFGVADVFDGMILLTAIMTVTAQDAETISRNNRSCFPR